jgi:beta-glucosidase
MCKEARDLVDRLTLEEKLLLVKGVGAWHTYPLERLGLESIMMSDGPHGLRKQESGGENPLGFGESVKTVCFPTAAGTAASFNRELLRQLGETLGSECRSAQVSLLLGPAVNIKRSPLCGRNFEYFSEDPYLSGEMAVAYTQGLQSQGVGASVKHFAANNQEKRRMTVRAVVDERALREIYFPAFEQTVRRAGPWTVMCAYNRLFDGIYCSENKRLLTDILREEWGFDGAVLSDWGAVSNRAKSIAAGLDIEMPDSGDLHESKLLAALDSGELSEAALDEACTRVIALVLRTAEAVQSDAEPVPSVDNEADHALARSYARESMVLLKNDGVLPLRKGANVAFIGGFAAQPRYQGGGSSHVNAYKIVSALHAAKAAGLAPAYAEGFGVRDYEYDPVKARQAVALARQCEAAVIFAGLPEHMDSEGTDRAHIALPPCQNALIAAVTAAQPNVVVVLHNGSAVCMPWKDDVAAILESYLAGEAVGEAQIDLLYGDYSPSAKLAETFPLTLQDTPCCENFPGGTATVEYRESIFVGYRYYDKMEKDVLFPFGHGLTYTNFEYTNLRLSRKRITPDETVDVMLTVRNEGERAAAEIVQIYVAPPAGEVFRAAQELKGFVKVQLNAGEKRRVSVTLDSRAFAYWHTGLGMWYCAPGEYTVLAAASSRDVRVSAALTVVNETQAPPPYDIQVLPSYQSGDITQVNDAEFEALLGYPLPLANLPVPRRLDWDSTLEDAAQQTLLGWLLRKIILHAQPLAQVLMGDSIGDVTTMLQSAVEMPVRTIAMWSGGFVNAAMADAIVSLYNSKKRLRSFCALAKGGVRAIKTVLRNAHD